MVDSGNASISHWSFTFVAGRSAATIGYNVWTFGASKNECFFVENIIENSTYNEQ